MAPEFMRGKVTLIGCPKLDGVDYTEKLTIIVNSVQMDSTFRLDNLLFLYLLMHTDDPTKNHYSQKNT